MVSTKRVLLVDDEEDLTWSISKHLQKDRASYELYTANSGRAALDILNQVPVDLVVSDIRMPEMSGLDLLLKIRENFPSTRVIIMTAYGSSEIQKEANERGCFKYIEKPFEITELRKLILKGVQDKKGFEGRVSDFQLADLIQMNCLGRLTNCLHIKKDFQDASIFFDDGNITHCQVGDLQGEAALYEILSWEGGTFSVEKGRKAAHETIIKGWQGLLIEGMRRADEKRKHEEGGDERIKRLKKLLADFGKKKGIVLIVVIGDDDKPIASFLKKEFENSQNTQRIAKPLLNLIEATVRMAMNLGMAGFRDMVVEMEGGLFELVSLPEGEEYFIVLAETSISLALLRMESKKVARQIVKILK